MVRVLPEQDDANGVEWREVQRLENVVGGWEDLVFAALMLDEPLERLEIGPLRL